MAKLSESGTLGVLDAAVTCYNSNCSTLGVEVSGTFVGTITFEDRKGKTWANAQVFTIAGVGAGATTTAPVTRLISAAGCNAVRARMSSYTSGEALVQFSGTEAAMGGAGGGGGGGAVTISDGADVAEGTTTDAAVTGDNPGTVNAHLRGLTKATGDPTDAAVVTDSNGTIIGFLRGLVKTLIATLTVQGAKTSNGAVPGATNVGTLPAVATAAVPSYTEGRMVAGSTDLSGRTRVTTETQTVLVGGTTAGGGAEVSNSVSIGFVGTGGTHRNATAANSVTNTTGNDILGVGNLVKGTTNYFVQAGDDSGNTKVVGTVAHDGVDSGSPVKRGAKAIAHGANPTAVSAADRTDCYANVAGIPFQIGGHPNIVSFTQNYTGAQTDATVVTVSAGTIIVVTSFMVTASNANTVNVSARLGFGTANVPAYGNNGIIGSHPGIGAGSGFGRGGGSGIVGIGADNEDLRLTLSVPTGGSCDLTVNYFTIPV